MDGACLAGFSTEGPASTSSKTIIEDTDNNSVTDFSDGCSTKTASKDDHQKFDEHFGKYLKLGVQEDITHRTKVVDPVCDYSSMSQP